MTKLPQSIYIAFYLYLIMVLVQWGVATFSKAKQPNAVPGKVDQDLSHDSFVFRAHRTFQNTLENSLLFVATVLFGIAIGQQGLWFGVLVWVYVIARIIHMALYYAIATEKNPSPRSYFFMLGLLANVALLGLLAYSLFI
ncbi:MULTISPECIES: MAPEG family protein [Alteromonadaceae]|uniref:MAPEG family protein n=1 Tax=Brumicola blandensis TaxID=3075611 RepID=A0AAW8R4P8_9ALTE|nr:MULTISPECIES: MAPEG family protein [unclassified Alteromonas]MDT0583394.1 MAPEG family protein [Alteromonas sp. W409]MDT0629325.1 MAPEG family protein [Alteromonas sp. W364]